MFFNSQKHLQLAATIGPPIAITSKMITIMITLVSIAMEPLVIVNAKAERKMGQTTATNVAARPLIELIGTAAQVTLRLIFAKILTVSRQPKVS